MDWEKAKTYILISFIILNIGLLTMRIWEQNRYNITAERVQNINTVLQENNISLAAGLMRQTMPMRPLTISGFYYDIDALLGIFFDGVDYISLIEDSGRIVFDTGSSYMIISNGFIFFDNTGGYPHDIGAFLFAETLSDSDELILPSHEDANNLAGDFTSRHFPDFEWDATFNTDEGVRVIHRQRYRNQIIHSNFIEFLVTADGITEIEMQFGRVIGHDGFYRRIFASDEALLTFMQRVRHIAMVEPITILRMDMVYLKEDVSDEPGSVSFAEPFYRVFIEGSDDPFLINAFTNVIIS